MLMSNDKLGVEVIVKPEHQEAAEGGGFVAIDKPNLWTDPCSSFFTGTKSDHYMVIARLTDKPKLEELGFVSKFEELQDKKVRGRKANVNSPKNSKRVAEDSEPK